MIFFDSNNPKPEVAYHARCSTKTPKAQTFQDIEQDEQRELGYDAGQAILRAKN